MNALHAIGIALALWPPIWSCGCLLWWLWRHRLVLVPRHASRRNAAAGTSSRPRAKPEDVRKKLLYLCARLDGAGCRTVADVFNRWHGGRITVGKTLVWEFMREHDAEIRERRRQRKRRRPRFVPVGHTWALDLTFVRSPFGTTFTVLGILDAGSRKLLRLEVLPTKRVLVILGHLLIAIGTHGLPAAIRTDNESMFLSKLWLATLKALSIAHRHGPPRQPWRNGRIERAFGTLKTALRGLRFATAQALQVVLDRFKRWHNEFRPHRGLDGLTPEESWQGKTMVDVLRAHEDRASCASHSRPVRLASFAMSKRVTTTVASVVQRCIERVSAKGQALCCARGRNSSEMTQSSRFRCVSSDHESRRTLKSSVAVVGNRPDDGRCGCGDHADRTRRRPPRCRRGHRLPHPPGLRLHRARARSALRRLSPRTPDDSAGRVEQPADPDSACRK